MVKVDVAVSDACARGCDYSQRGDPSVTRSRVIAWDRPLWRCGRARNDIPRQHKPGGSKLNVTSGDVFTHSGEDQPTRAVRTDRSNTEGCRCIDGTSKGRWTGFPVWRTQP